jgi:hypothetical protein
MRGQWLRRSTAFCASTAVTAIKFISGEQAVPVLDARCGQSLMTASGKFGVSDGNSAGSDIVEKKKGLDFYI